MQIQRVSKILRPRLVTFDVTGTLLETNLAKHYAEVSALHGVTVTNPQILAPSFKQHFSRQCREHPVFGKHTGLGWENWWRNIVFNVLNDQNTQIPQDKLDKIATSLINDYGTNKCWYEFPGAVNILKYLNDHGIIVGVISNFDNRLESILISLKLRKYFQFVLTSYDHGEEKPHHSIFAEALTLAEKKYGNVISPHEALHIGDNFKLDYNGAKNAGWNAFLMKHGEKLRENEDIPQHEFFHSLDELQNYFEI